MTNGSGTNVAHLIDARQRTVSPRVFSDPELYRLEQEKIFGHCWLFVAHESQLPNPGDFITNTMGDESVIICRDLEGQIRGFVNSCRHRGMRICRVDQGNTKLLQCPYHSWTYNLQGKLLGHDKEEGGGVFGGLKRGDWGLLQIPRIESYRGLIFGCFDEKAESLDDYLGDVKWYLDLLLNRTAGGMVPFPGTHKWTMNANWKFAAEQFSGDVYHVGAHESLFRMNLLTMSLFMKAEPDARNYHMKTEQGHSWLTIENTLPPGALSEEVGQFYARVKAEAAARLTTAQNELVDNTNVGFVFPNLGIVSLLGMVTFRLWQPRGLNRMDIWSWGFVDRDAPPAVMTASREVLDRTFSSAGLFEQDDLEMWEGCTQGAQGFYRKRFPLNYQTGWQHDERDPQRPGRIDELLSDYGSFHFYQRWQELIHNGTATSK